MLRATSQVDRLTTVAHVRRPFVIPFISTIAGTIVGVLLVAMTVATTTRSPMRDAAGVPSAAEHTARSNPSATADLRATPSTHESRRRSALGSSSLLTTSVSIPSVVTVDDRVDDPRSELWSRRSVLHAYDATAPPARLI